jgi:GNAT superfamily N-acetyltransferase
MLSVQQIDTTSRKEIEQFIKFPYRLYKNCPQWVPPLFMDARLPLQRDKHPFYEHSTGDFFIALREGKVVGRIAALENIHYNQYHATRTAQFYYFDSENEPEIAAALFERVYEWAHKRGCNKVMGPKGFSAIDGYGIQVEGFEHRTIMTMMNYNYEYYPRLLEGLGFQKEVDFVSCYVHLDDFIIPERIHRIADRIKQRGSLGVEEFKSKKDLKRWAPRIGKAYNKTFVNNWEYAPLTEREINLVLENILVVADPRLIKVITHKDEAVGFLLGFPDLSEGLQKANGKLLPLGILHLLRSMRTTDWIAVNGLGILPEFQGFGGNALLYSELDKTLHAYQGRFHHVDMTQVAESAVQMRRDLINLGGKPYKNHRVYSKNI